MKTWSMVTIKKHYDRRSYEAVRFRVEDPTHGGWFTFDLVVSREGFNDKRYRDVEWDGAWWARVWHRLARPFRRVRR